MSTINIDEVKSTVCARIDALSTGLLDVSHDIHAHPELNYEEHHAHAVLTRDRPTQAYAGFQDVGTKLLTAVQLVGVVGIKKDEWMQVAIARMKDVANTDIVAGCDFFDFFQNLWKFAARYDAILGDHTWSEPTSGSNSFFSGYPEFGSIFWLYGNSDFPGVILSTDIFDAVCIVVQSRVKSIQFNDQNSGRIFWKTKMKCIFNSLQNELVDHF